MLPGAILALALGSPAQAQEPVECAPEEGGAELTGRVEAFGAGLPVAEAHIILLDEAGEPRCEVMAGEGGAFALPLPAGLSRLRVQHTSYAPLAMEEELEPGQRLEVVYRLRPPEGDEELVVYGEREREEVARQVISGEELRKVPGTFGDPVRALQSLPGVARPQTLEGNLVVRGAEGINTSFTVDELPVPFLFHSLVGKSIVNPAFVDDVEFYPGGMPSRFGEVLQAAVNVRTDVEPITGHRGEVDLNLLDLGVAYEWGRGPWTLRGAGRVSWVGNVVGLVAGISILRHGGRFKDASYVYPIYWDALLSAERRVAEGTWSSELIASRDGLYLHDGQGALASQEELPFDPSHLIDAAFLRWRLRYRQESGRHRSDTWLALGPRVQQSLLGDPFQTGEGPYYGRVRGFSWLGRREDRWTLSPRHRLVAGGQVQVERLEVEDYTQAWSDAGRVPTIDDTQVGVALFGEWQWRPGPWLVAPGLRGSFHRFDGRAWWEPEPRLTLRRELSPAVTLKAAAGRYTQVPPVERYAAGADAPELPLMTAWQASAGAEWRRGSWSLDSAFFASHMQHLVVADTELVFRGSGWGGGLYAEEVPVYPEVTGRALGWEGQLRLDPSGPFWGWAGLTLSRSLRIDGDGGVYPGDYDQPVALTLLAAWKGPKSWEASARFRLTSGHPYTPQAGVYDPQSDLYLPYEGALNSARFPWFHQLDLRAEKTWHPRRADVGLYLDVYNAYWARNPIVATYSYDYSHLVTTLYIPLIPSMGLVVDF